MNISDEAVEAAARALDPQTMSSGGPLAEKFQEQTRAEALRILEAAEPYLAQDAKAEAVEAYKAGHRDAATGKFDHTYRISE